MVFVIMGQTYKDYVFSESEDVRNYIVSFTCPVSWVQNERSNKIPIDFYSDVELKKMWPGKASNVNLSNLQIRHSVVNLRINARQRLISEWCYFVIPRPCCIKIIYNQVYLYNSWLICILLLW